MEVAEHDERETIEVGGVVVWVGALVCVCVGVDGEVGVKQRGPSRVLACSYSGDPR